MVLAAGLGKRMRPITDTMPKPLVPVAGKTLLDRGLDSLAAAGVERAVVNVHHLPEQIVAHVAGRTRPRIVISDESDGLARFGRRHRQGAARARARSRSTSSMPTRSGSTAATPISNGSPLHGTPARMDILIMLADLAIRDRAHSGGTDFLRRRRRRARGAPRARRQGLIYAGAAIVHPRIFADAAAEPHSLNLYFDRAIAARTAVRHGDGWPLDHRRHAGRDPARRSGRRRRPGRAAT